MGYRRGKIFGNSARIFFRNLHLIVSLDEERNYKVAASTFAKEVLSEKRISGK